jgi:L-amino acid N-acyltransferase YncA
MGKLTIRRAGADDAAAIAALYAPFVASSQATFEEVPPDAAEVARRISGGEIDYPWLVADEDGRLIGYASSSCFRQRSAYRWAVETGVYVAEGAQRRGVARALLGALIEALVEAGFVTAIASISLPNGASAGLHEALGYRLAGTIRAPGYKLGAWVDIGYWQRDLAERRVPPSEPGASSA